MEDMMFCHVVTTNTSMKFAMFRRKGALLWPDTLRGYWGCLALRLLRLGPERR